VIKRQFSVKQDLLAVNQRRQIKVNKSLMEGDSP